MTILAAVWQSYQRFIGPQQTIFVACSGGRDSMVLVWACLQLGLPIQVIHINHRIQAMSDSWQALVTAFCQQHQLVCHSVVVAWDKPLEAINEQDARQARYQAIVNLAGENAIVALAHHANDQAETLLLNLCQGTGLNGLVGMAEFSEQREFDRPILLWRPLLNIRREDISEVARTQQLPYVDDPTNHIATLDGGNQRAFLREYVLPQLTARFDNLVANLRRTQTNLAEVREIITAQVQQDLLACQCGEPSAYQQCLDVIKLRHLTAARRFQLLHHWVKGPQKFAPPRQFIEQVDGLLNRDNPAQQTILAWQGHQIRRYRDTLYRLSPNYVNLLTDAKAISSARLENQPLPPCYPQHLTHQYEVHRLLPNQSLQRRGKPYHEPFKKICQRLGVPSWERPLARLLKDKATERMVALLLPSHWVWLADTDEFVIK